MKSLKMLRALAITLFTAFLVTGCGGEGPYESFSLAMDNLAGEGQWSDKGHSTGFFGGVLTVEGVVVKSEVGNLEIATVELKKPLEKEKLQAVIQATDWKEQKETTIAEGLILKGVKRVTKNGEIGYDELNLEGLALAAADANAISGPAGFLKATRVAKAGYKNFKMKVSGDTALDFLSAQMNANGLSFDAEPLAGLDIIDPSGMATVFSSFSAKNLSFKDMTLDIARNEASGKPGAMKFALGGLEQKGLRGPFRAADALALTNLTFSFEIGEGGPPATFSLASMNFNEIDVSDYQNTVMPVILAAYSEGGNLDDAVNGAQTFADFFVSSASLKDGSVKGLDFKIGNIVSMKLAEATITGPMTAGTVSPRQATAVTGLEIILPQSPEGLGEDALELYQFGQDFGLSTFVMDIVSEGSYDAATGRLTSNTSKISLRELMDMSLAINMGGLTAERLEALKGVTLDNALIALMDPVGVFGALSIENIDLTLNNQGLVERIYAYAGKTKLNGAPVENVKDMAAGAVTIGLAAQGSMYLANPEGLSTSLSTFLKDPKSLKITLRADPPLSFAAAQEFSGDQNALLNSLNLSVAANGEADVQPLRFNIPLAPADLSQMDDDELEEYLEGDAE